MERKGYLVRVRGFTPFQILKDIRMTVCNLQRKDSLITKDSHKRFGTGFTLIELMLVVIIIGVLVAMVMPRLAGRSQEARIAAARADIFSNISTALGLYELDNGKYPESLDELLKKSSTGRGPYLKRKPIDPWKRPYKYKSPGVQTPDDYDLYSLGPDGQEGTSDDITNWEQDLSTEE